MGAINRRDYLKLMGLVGFGVTAPILVTNPIAGKQHDKSHHVSKTRPLMGCLVNIDILDSSKDKAEEVLDQAFARMAELVNIFNRHATNTPVSRLNKESVLKDAPPELTLLLSHSAYYNRISNGAFDITMLPLLELYKKTFEKSGAAPSQQEINDKIALTGFDNIKMNKHEIRLSKEGMQITFDGIATGYIVDQAVYLMEQRGIKYALINAGGDIRAIGGNGPDKAWKVGIKDPWGGKECLAAFELNNGAVATSGNYEQFFDKDKLYNHIIDPSTGLSPRQTVSTTAIAPTTMEADALSTTLFLLEPHESVGLADSLANIEAMVISRNKEQIYSQGWKQLSA
ncbi:MAG: FAD:protein FMN transferase [Pseudomonadota bacterium]